MAVSKRLRHEVMRRDNYTCKYCRTTEGKLTIDHVVPTTLGGSDDPSNLVTACEPCNSGKSASSPDAMLVADVSDDAARWAAAMQYVAQEAAAQREQRDDDQDWFYNEWSRYTNDRGCPPPLEPGWRTSVDAWRQAGLTRADLGDLIASVMARANIRERFRYFCGAAWTAVRARQERARAYLADQDADDEVDGELDDDEDDDVACDSQEMFSIARRLEHVDTTYWCICRDDDYTLHTQFTPCVSLSTLVVLIADDNISGLMREVGEDGVAKGYATYCPDCCMFDPHRGTRAMKAAGVVRVLEAA